MAPLGDTPPEHRESLDIRLRMRQAPNVLRRIVRHPRWLIENLRLILWRRAEPRDRIALVDYREHVLDERTAVLAALEVSEAEYETAKAQFWAPPSDPAAPMSTWDARQSLHSLVSVAVRLVSRKSWSRQAWHEDTRRPWRVRPASTFRRSSMKAGP